MKLTDIEARISKIANDMMAKYPDSAPTQEEKKEWREEAEDRRRKDGIRPRK